MAKTQVVRIVSTFHRNSAGHPRGTNVRIPAAADPVEWQTEVSEAVRKRVRRDLCGLGRQCSCGTRVAGTPGPRPLDIYRYCR